MHGGFRRRGFACERKLTKRECRVPLAELSDLPQLRGQLPELAGAPEPLDRAQLLVRGATGADEVGVVGVREPIGTGASRGQHGAFLEGQYRAPGSGEREHSFDRVGALRVRDRVAAPIGDAEVDSLLGCEARHELGAFRLGATKLEMR